MGSRVQISSPDGRGEGTTRISGVIRQRLADSLRCCVAGLVSGEAFVQEMVPEPYGSAGLAAGATAILGLF